MQPTTRADYVLEALPEAIFARIGPWLDQQPDEIPYDDLKKHLLMEFSHTISERARRLLSLPSQPMDDRKPSHLWDKICTLNRLPEVDTVSKQHKEVDLKKEIWLQSLPSSVRVLLRNTDDKSMDELLSLADDITMSQKAPELRLSLGASAKHGVQHFIKTTGPPVHSRYRRLRPELHHIAKEAFTEMEKIGVCSKAASPWASPIHMIPKKDGTWRPCGDYRRLNLITEPDHYAMPNISDLTSSISTSRVISKLDLLKGYFQVPVNPDDVPKTAITTPFGTYVFHYATFGLRNSGATFQRMMDHIFGHLPYSKVYIDAILVASESTENIFGLCYNCYKPMVL